MDKGAIKKYAIWARKELIERVTQKAYQYGIHEDNQITERIEKVNGRLLTSEEQRQRRQLIAEVRVHGFETVMEEIAYTWFNRFAALRFMEVNGYLPTHIRVFTDDNGRFVPQILTEAVHLELEGLDREKVFAYIEANEKDTLYKYLLIMQCNALGDILPDMFEKIADYTELLFPENLLREGSVIEQMVTLIPEADWNISVPDEKGQPQGQVEIIGWLYQYYNTEPKDIVFANLKKNIKISKENIPAATQLFTPDWIVRYMVENSLGRLWLDGHADTELQAGWKYYLSEAEQEPVVKKQLEELRKDAKYIQPQDIRIIDPCMGSGHILVYAFDVLMQIYEAAGYAAREAAQSILEHNLYGIDIDKRAYQLASFALFMKARQYNRRILTKKVGLHLAVIEESNGLQRWDELSGTDLVGGRQLDFDSQYVETANYLIDVFQDAKEYGSILKIESRDYDGLLNYIERLQQNGSDGNLLFDSWIREMSERLPGLVKQAKLLAGRYDVVVTNPPYMGGSGMNADLAKFVKKEYPDSKSDLFAVFIERCMMLACSFGYVGMMTSYTWMFLSSYTILRQKLLQNHAIISLVQPEYHALFEEAYVPLCSFVLNQQPINYTGEYVRLQDFYGADLQPIKYLEAVRNNQCNYRFTAQQGNFAKIPGMPIAYWVSKYFIENFTNGKVLANIANSRVGLQTSNNNRFLRYWYECSYDKEYFNCNNLDECKKSKNKWYPHNKGGSYRKWYGNHEYVINYQFGGRELYHTKGAATISEEYVFKDAITYSRVTTKAGSFRYQPIGFIFDSACVNIFDNTEEKVYILGLLNSKITKEYLNILAPSMNTQPGDIAKLPIIYSEQGICKIRKNVQENISSSKKDWDSFETSWEFMSSPLLCHEKGNPHVLKKIIQDYNQFREICNMRFLAVKDNEEELNRIFIDIYGLAGELTPEVADKDVTITRIYDTKEEIPESMKGNNYVLTKADVIKSFISYAVGCMMGRYSIYKEGLFYAGGPGGDLGSLVEKIQDALHAEGKSRFPKPEFYPDKDAILPICEDEYFEDDIVNLFVKFVSVVYGEDTLAENLQFIADALGGKGTPREVLRSYFLNDFYKDHCKTYQKRPIYWLCDAGKKNSFKALVYLHRYRSDTIARLRTDYVHEQQERYHTAIAQLEAAIDKAASTAESVRLKKKLKKFTEQAAELHDYEEKVHHLADQMISIDLDDGVKKNYAIFQDILAKIK